MSPSRRRAIGAVRGLASRAPWLRALARAPLLRALAHAPWYGAAALPRVGMTKRRALRGYRGRTETPPAKLSACPTCHYARHATREFARPYSHAWGARALPVRRDGRPPGLPARAIGNPRGRRLNELAVCRLFDSGQFEIQIGNCLACAYDLAANGDLAAAGTRFGAVSFPIAG